MTEQPAYSADCDCEAYFDLRYPEKSGIKHCPKHAAADDVLEVLRVLRVAVLNYLAVDNDLVKLGRAYNEAATAQATKEEG